MGKAPAAYTAASSLRPIIRTMFPQTLVAILLALIAGLGAQATPPAARIQLFLIERPVGFETVSEMRVTEGGRTRTSEIELVDRGTRLQVTASLSVRADGTPMHFKASGRSYRFVNVDTEVIADADGKTVRVRSMGDKT